MAAGPPQPPNPLQNDYKRYPKSTRGPPILVDTWAQITREGRYDLSAEELFWRDIQPFLLERGYRLRPRYAPDWSPSWVGTDINPVYCEDSRVTLVRLSSASSHFVMTV